ncbi:hypothetical protein GQX74_000558 [Glossina fuscipes]|nr:hypothetical protein GQX74_000558 [Glossina fuscipes]
MQAFAADYVRFDFYGRGLIEIILENFNNNLIDGLYKTVDYGTKVNIRHVFHYFLSRFIDLFTLEVPYCKPGQLVVFSQILTSVSNFIQQSTLSRNDNESYQKSDVARSTIRLITTCATLQKKKASGPEEMPTQTVRLMGSIKRLKTVKAFSVLDNESVLRNTNDGIREHSFTARAPQSSVLNAFPLYLAMRIMQQASVALIERLKAYNILGNHFRNAFLSFCKSRLPANMIQTTISKRTAEGEGCIAYGIVFGLGESTIRGIPTTCRPKKKKSCSCAANEDAKRAAYTKIEKALVLRIEELTQKRIAFNGESYDHLKDLETSCSSSHIASSKFSASIGWLLKLLQRHVHTI